MSRFAVVLPRRPISANKGPNPKYSDAIAAAASARKPPLLKGPLYARIVWFHKRPTTQDVDNIAKRILDSLKGVLYGDDNSVAYCLTARVDATADYQLGTSTPSEADYDNLLNLLADETEDHVLYVEVGQRASTGVQFGEVL